MRSNLTAFIAASLALSPAQAVPCGMALGFNQADGQSSLPVWEDGRGTGLLFADGLNVNTDGTRRSYSVDDFWGETRALNNLCNAMSDACAGLSKEGLRARRILTQQAKARGWPADMLEQTRISPSIIPRKDGKPCPEVDGYLVSATSLHRQAMRDPCDISNYADALSVPAIVIPKRARGGVATPFEVRNANIGDLVVLMRAGSSNVHYAVVGDRGPAKSLGEVSVALAADLLGRSAPPSNYREIRGRGPYRGRGWVVPKTFVLILPGTRNQADPYMTRAAIERNAAARFASWGGQERLAACAAAYSGH
jgi:hypothetical protein